MVYIHAVCHRCRAFQAATNSSPIIKKKFGTAQSAHSAFSKLFREFEPHHKDVLTSIFSYKKYFLIEINVLRCYHLPQGWTQWMDSCNGHRGDGPLQRIAAIHPFWLCIDVIWNRVWCIVICEWRTHYRYFCQLAPNNIRIELRWGGIWNGCVFWMNSLKFLRFVQNR